jgi:hypothetical protein
VISQPWEELCNDYRSLTELLIEPTSGKGSGSYCDFCAEANAWCLWNA